jgi:unsaturated chondroitin disaccharide hydrolase
MMNLSLLYWAGEQLQDPRFAFIAGDHADTALKYLVREDGSCNHIAILDPLNGALLETPAGQGYAAGSSWTRGQAWALYGFTITYRHSGEIRYLEAARRIAQYFREEVMRFGYVPPVDFRAPLEPKIIDTSAGAIAACGLLALAEIQEKHRSNFATPGEESENLFLQDAVKILKAIETAHGDWDITTDGFIKMATAQYHDKLEERHIPLIYGDYFFTEAVNRLRGANINIW